MPELQGRDIGVMIGMITKTLNPLGQIFAGLQMSRSVPVALGPGPIEREIDHRAQHQGGSQWLTQLQRIRRRRSSQ